MKVISRVAVLYPLALFLLPVLLSAQPSQHPDSSSLLVEHGTYQVHLLLHTIGTESYDIRERSDHNRILTTRIATNDRGMKRTTVATLELGPHSAPIRLEQISGDVTSSAEIDGMSATIHEGAGTRRITKPAIAYVGFPSMPAAVQMSMMRYWFTHHQPAHLPILRASPKALPLEIKLVGHEAFPIKGKIVRLARYTVGNLIFGREILWMNESGRLAALMTFAGGLPQEMILDEYAEATGSLVRSGVRQELLDLADIQRDVPVEAETSFAIVGARLIDGTGAAPVENATVVIRNNRIAAVGGPSLAMPAGLKILHAEGQSLLPGLWEMHSHYSGVEFGPALLAAGVTTARDCGGELLFLTTVRREIAEHQALGPRLLLAGLIDSDPVLGFGEVNAETPEQGVAAVDEYADQDFQQIKVYTQLSPAVLRAVAAEAHRRGLTVTGHVPAAVTTAEGITGGMDQINHLQYVTRALMMNGKLDLEAPQSKAFLALLKERNIVVDPTESWGEMARHPRSIDAASFEPGVNAAPYTLASKFRAMGVAGSDAGTDEEKFRANMDISRKVVAALHHEGITIVPGSDTGLIGYGLDRELELYVQAGFTPMEAIQAATLVSARAMHLEAESGSIEPGKRADLILIDGNPLDNLSNLRRVVSVVTNGRMYSSVKLAHTVGFTRTNTP
jgi:imidazolonepropionase-like amidohydrolase